MRYVSRSFDASSVQECALVPLRQSPQLRVDNRHSSQSESLYPISAVLKLELRSRTTENDQNNYKSKFVFPEMKHTGNGNMSDKNMYYKNIF